MVKNKNQIKIGALLVWTDIDTVINALIAPRESRHLPVTQHHH